MRLLPVAGLVLLAAACSASEDAQLKAFRDSSVQGCLSAMRGKAPPQLNAERFCNCATDRLMQGKSAAELAQLRPGGPGQAEIAEQCAMEQVSPQSS